MSILYVFDLFKLKIKITKKKLNSEAECVGNIFSQYMARQVGFPALRVMHNH